jgi:hypothetical protein
MKKILLTTSSDDNLWELSEKLIPHNIKAIEWDGDHCHFHDGEKCIKMFPEFVPIKNRLDWENPTTTNNVYRTIIDYLQSNSYERWLHIDGDVWFGGLNPSGFIKRVIEEDKPNTRLQPGCGLSLREDGELRVSNYNIITSQIMYIDVKYAIERLKRFLDNKFKWTFENTLFPNNSWYPCLDMPLWFLPIHTHIPNDKSSGKERYNRLCIFLKKFYQYEDYKGRDNKRYPFAKEKVNLMRNFRSDALGRILCYYPNILVKNFEQYVLPFREEIPYNS